MTGQLAAHGRRSVSREEAVVVCKWVFEKEPLMDLGKTTKNIIFNLVGESADA